MHVEFYNMHYKIKIYNMHYEIIKKENYGNIKPKI